MNEIIYLVESGLVQGIYNSEYYNSVKESMGNAKVTKYYPESLFTAEQTNKNHYKSECEIALQRNLDLASDRYEMQKEIDQLKQEKQSALNKIKDLEENVSKKIDELEILTKANNKQKEKGQTVVLFDTRGNIDSRTVKIFDTDATAVKFQKKFDNSRKFLVDSGVQISHLNTSKKTYEVITETCLEENSDSDVDHEYETDEE